MATSKDKINIMVGYDVSYTSLDVFRLAKKMAKSFKAKLHVVSSVVGGKMSKEGELTHDVAEHGLQDIKKTLKEEGIDYSTHLIVRGDDPGKDIVEFAKKHKIDHIVIGVSKRSNIGEILFGSTARHVIINAPCPVTSVNVRE